MMNELPEPLIFEWDEGNEQKNWRKHNVTIEEAEQVFFDESKLIYPDPTHSEVEPRKIIVGKTLNGRNLFIVFTLRNNKVRVISARDLNKRKEKSLYEKTPHTS
ncbi:MAG TPA: BrnT family toxin [Patescibacteria group bacterium]